MEALLMLLAVLVLAGAALGPLLAGLLSAGGWNQVFYMLMTADFLALLVSVSCPYAHVFIKTCLFTIASLWHHVARFRHEENREEF